MRSHEADSTGATRARTPSSHAPLYRELLFHRTIPGLLAQSGCPLGNGTGEPGTIGSMQHLAGRVTVLGRCDDLDVVTRIAARTTTRAVLHAIEIAPDGDAH